MQQQAEGGSQGCPTRSRSAQSMEERPCAWRRHARTAATVGPAPTGDAGRGEHRRAERVEAHREGAPLRLAEGESVIEYKFPLNVLKYTYDHSCY
jgi:hypothetical protein